MATQADHSRFLRRSLQLDGVASGLCGAVLLFAAQPISTLFGLSTSGVARIVGGLLLVYAAALLWNARRLTVSRGETLLAVALNAAWVLGSLMVVVDGPLTLIGNAAVAAVAAAVLGFAVLEVLGLRRLREAY
jgi:putative intracellular protease/amidase